MYKKELERIRNRLTFLLEAESVPSGKTGSKILDESIRLWGGAKKDPRGGLRVLLDKVKAKIYGLFGGKVKPVGHMEAVDDQFGKDVEKVWTKVKDKLLKVGAGLTPLVSIVVVSMAMVLGLFALSKLYKYEKGMDLFESIKTLFLRGFQKVGEKFSTLLKEMENVSTVKGALVVLMKSVFRIFMIPGDFFSGILEGVEKSEIASFTVHATSLCVVSFAIMMLILTPIITSFA